MTHASPITKPRAPRPLMAALKATSWRTILGTLVTAAVSFGVLDSIQATAINNIVAAVVTVVTAATGLLHAFGVVGRGEPNVTPVADPHDDTGARLVRQNSDKLLPPDEPPPIG